LLLPEAPPGAAPPVVMKAPLAPAAAITLGVPSLEQAQLTSAAHRLTKLATRHVPFGVFDPESSRVGLP